MAIDRAGVPAVPPQLPLALGGAALGMAVGGLALLLLCRLRLGRVLAGRRPETDARVLRTAAELARDLGLPRTPQLSRCDALPSPIAFGLLRPEVCLPPRTLELGDDELRALLGHELAHVVRGDSWWLWSGAFVQALLPWQFWLVPLRRRLHAIAELRCDAVAARLCHPVAVAQCLVQVASWYDAAPAPRAVLAHAMAARRSALRERVEAALTGDGDGDRGGRRVPRLAAGVLVVLAAAATTAAAPGVRPTSHDAAADARSAADPTVGSPRRGRESAAADRRALRAPETQPARALRDEFAALARERDRLLAEARAVVRDARGAAEGDDELRQLLGLVEARAAALQDVGRQVQARIESTTRGNDPARRQR